MRQCQSSTSSENISPHLNQEIRKKQKTKTTSPHLTFRPSQTSLGITVNFTVVKSGAEAFLKGLLTYLLVSES